MLLDTLVPRVQQAAPSVPDNVALLELRDCVRRFLRKVKLWSVTLTLSSVEDQVAYEMDVSGEVSAGAAPTVYRIQQVLKNNSKIADDGYFLRSSDGYLVFETSNTPDADDTDDMEVQVVLAPAFDGTDYPQWLIEKYFDAIVGGAVDFVMKTPNKPYTDPSGARRYRTEYKRGIIQARSDIGSEGTEREGGYVASKDNPGGISA